MNRVPKRITREIKVDRGEASPDVLDYLAPGIRFNEDDVARAQG